MNPIITRRNNTLYRSDTPGPNRERYYLAPNDDPTSITWLDDGHAEAFNHYGRLEQGLPPHAPIHTPTKGSNANPGVPS